MASIRNIAGLDLSIAEQGDGYPFVFQHGLCGDALQPEQVFPHGEGYRCLTVECRGHGGSEAGDLDDLSIPAFADDITAYIETSGIRLPVIGGISMGAAIALRLAVTRPHLAKALVVARPAWLADARPTNMRPNELAGEFLKDYDPADARRRYDASEIAKQLELVGPDNLASIRGFFSRRPFEATAALLCKISADGPQVTEEQIRAIQIPTLVIGHSRDFVHPLAYARTLAEWIPNSRLVEITPKADDANRYRSDFRFALSDFLKEL